MKLYKHQQDFLDKNPDIAILCWEAGTGKTLAAIEWIKLREGKSALIAVPKSIKKKWEDDLVKWGCKNECLVLTKEEFKKYEGHKDLLIVDEVHNYASPLFIAKLRSQLSEQLYNYIEKYNPDRLLLSATLVRSAPHNLHTILTFLGIEIEWKKWQDYFYNLVKRPYNPRPFYEPIKGWQKKMPPIIKKYCHVVRMSDCVDVPVHEYQYIDIPLSKKTQQAIRDLKGQEWEATALWYAENRLENGIEKLDWIKEYSEGHPKVVIVCKYREQIAMYAEALKDREVFTLTGSTKNQGQVIQDAQDSPECYLLIQSSVSAGYDLDSFSIMIFASMDWGYVNKVQMEARINRIHNLHRNQYIYLIGGEKDRAVVERLKLGRDFDVSLIR